MVEVDHRRSTAELSLPPVHQNVHKYFRHVVYRAQLEQNVGGAQIYACVSYCGRRETANDSPPHTSPLLCM